MIRLLIADDQSLFREGLCKIISDWDEFEVAGQASSGFGAVEAYALLKPDIVLMDLNMPGMNGIDATKEILARWPDARVVILTVSEEGNELFETILSGACGFIQKDTPIDMLRFQLMAAAKGETPLSGPAATKLVERMRSAVKISSPAERHERFNPADSLTEREHDVLALLGEGLSNSEIAQRLFISEKTVKKHLNSIYVKINVSNRAQAAIYAIRAGIV
ncbi:MAG: response regulator transcription factor [Eggerthellaceae bacterium]|nr:response regulator transcription factor [Eggerthellaceae bacterium]